MMDRYVLYLDATYEIVLKQDDAKINMHPGPSSKSLKNSDHFTFIGPFENLGID